MSLREPPFPGCDPVEIPFPPLGAAVVDAHPDDPRPGLVAISRAGDRQADPFCFARSSGGRWAFEDAAGLPVSFDGDLEAAARLEREADGIRRAGCNAQYARLLADVAEYDLSGLPGTARIDLGDSADHVLLACATRFAVGGSDRNTPIRLIRCEYRREGDAWLPGEVDIRTLRDGALGSEADMAAAAPRARAIYEFRNAVPLFLERHRDVFVDIAREISAFRDRLREHDRDLSRARERADDRGLEYA